MSAFVRLAAPRPLPSNRAYLGKHERSEPWESLAIFYAPLRGGMVKL